MRARLVAGRYRLVRELGRGGMGVVWLAEDQLVGRRVAVKELRPPSGLPPAERELFGRRALQEARSVARVHHPGAVGLYDVLPSSAGDDAVYLIMELVEGPTLAEAIQRHGRLPDAVVAGYGLQVLSVLEAAHALGVVHRDVKPGNIIIASGDQVKLTDFGIAHTLGDPRLTRTGVLGTQAYLAPELFESAPITPAADVWSLGATLFHAAEGRGAFERDTTGATLRALLIDEMPVPRCGPGLAAAIGGMLQRDPAHRVTTDQARVFLLTPAAQPAPETPRCTGVTQDQAVTVSPATGFPRQDRESTSTEAPEQRWDQIPTTFAPSVPAPPRAVPAPPDVGSAASSDARGPRLAAGAILGLGTILGIVGLFPGYVAGLSLASQPYELVVHLPYILVWAAATAGVLRGGATARPAVLLGTGLGAVSCGFFFEDLTAVLVLRLGAGPGLVLSLLGWAACTAGSVYGLVIHARPGDSVPRRAIEPLGVLVLAAAIGTAVTLWPAWTSYTLVRGGSSRTITEGNDFTGPWTIIAGTVAVMVALVAITVIAALRRPAWNGAVMLAGAIVPMIAQPISSVISNGQPISPVFLGISPSEASGMTITVGETPDFWIYCALLILLIVSCVRMLTKCVRAPAPSRPGSEFWR